ncbi:MAG: glycoside hydrolase family 127 protein [Bacteroidetes bacterium]|nr:glycoside hydrolase family 127 protein [Bacteroidota bacterium]MBS1540955.1 glycoside hydrolase family 127 protein [Bacteroidota bacterium]
MKTLFLITGLSLSIHALGQSWATIVTAPSNDALNSFYHTNQPPLKPQHLVKLPVGVIKPGGWLLKTLQLEREGLAGHLGEISAWLTKKNNAWLNKDGKGEWGWEELPYWLKGYANMGYVLNDKKMINEAMVWINGTLNSQRDNGDFGPYIIRNSTGKRDLWAQMLMLFVLQSYYEYSNDPRVITHLSNYFKWQLSIPENDFLTDYWENSRGGDNLYSVYWLYNITKEKWLLDLAEKIHRNTANWKLKNWLPNWHNVNIAQCFREPATFYQQSGDLTDLQASYDNQNFIRAQYGQVPGGMWGGDENSRKGYTDPRQAVETCGMVEQMTSDEIMMRITGDPFWAENCEDVALNTFSAAFMPDYKSLRYLTAPNMVVSDSQNHHPGIDNPGPHLNMNPFSSRCCQHNHTSGWVYYAENLWMATPDNGLASVLYSASEVTAKVGDGAIVTIAEQTHYPFDETINLKLTLSQPALFPLYLRIPAWCNDAKVYVNNEAVTMPISSGKYLKINRNWKTNDLVRIEFPMKIKIRVWANNKNSVSVDRGPLTYSVKINEKYIRIDSKQTAQYDAKWQEHSDPSQWPSYEIQPASAWNYGLSANLAALEKSFVIINKPWPADDFPFTPAAVPVELKIKAKKIPGWTIDQYGLCAELPQSPVSSGEPEEEIVLIPMGAARLRIAAFPVTK